MLLLRLQQIKTTKREGKYRYSAGDFRSKINCKKICETFEDLALNNNIKTSHFMMSLLVPSH